ncbi:ice-binding family protein [Adhaeribacter soli]|nr:ice-binding family protein [Adhaeribacter soli]
MGNFTVLAGSSITNTGNSIIYDNVGIWPGNTITGFPPGYINGSQHINNATSQNAHTDLTIAYNNVAAQAPTVNLTGQNLGGRNLTAGVYRFNGNADLTGTLTLDGSGNANAVFIFQVLGNLTTSPNAILNMRQGARSPNIFWQVTGSVNMAAGTNFKGTVMADQNITMGNGAILQGRLLARNGFVSLDNNPLTIPPPRFNSDISIEKTVNAGPYSVGDLITYKVVVKNLGPSNETNLLVNDILPASLTYKSFQTSNKTTYNPATGFWSIDVLNNGAADTLTITATIIAPNFITNTATVTGDGIDNNQLNNASTVTICARPAKPTAILGPDVLCIGGIGNTYSIPAVAGATSYTWSVPSGWTIMSGQNTTSINLLPGPDTASAIVSVIASNGCGESLPSIKKILAFPPPPADLPAITGNAVPCQFTTGNVYSIPQQLAVSNYTWSVPAGWTITSGQGTPSITVTAGASAGVISVIASNDCGTSNPSNLNVEPASAAPVAPGQISPPFAGNPCVGQVSLTYSVQPVPKASSYTWTVPAGWTIVSGQGTPSIVVTVGSNNGTISVFASNGCGDSPVSTMTVVPATNPPLTAGPITGEFIPCIGQTNVTYSVPAQPGVTTFNWTVPHDWTIVSGQGTNSINVSLGTAAGTVDVSVSNGCGTSSASTAVVTPSSTVPPTPGVIVGSAGGAPCAGRANMTYTILPVSAASTYTWTVPTGWAITAGQGTPTITVTAGNAAGLISVVAANGCGSSTASTLALTPTSTPPPAPVSIAGNAIPCAGSLNNGYSIAFVNGATSYIWAVPTGWTITSGQGTTSIQVIAGNTNGNISVMAMNDCGVSTATLLPVTAASAVPAMPGAITGGSDVCINQNGITFSIPVVANASGYTWSVPSGWTIISGQGTPTITVNTGTAGGTISVAATNGCGGGAPRTFTIIPNVNPPVAPGAISGNIVPCTGQSNVTYSIAGLTGISNYAWSVPAGWTITSGQGTTSITVTTGNNSGAVTVRGVNSCGNGAISTLAVTPSSAAAPAPGAIAGSSVPCIGQTGATYAVAAVAGASSYNWTVPTGWTITAGQGTPSINVTVGTTAGTVTVTAANGCGTGVASTLAATPTFSNPATPRSIIGNSVPCTSGGNITYSVPIQGNTAAFTWTVPAGWLIVSGQGSGSIVVTPGTAAGNIEVVASNGCGASAPAILPVMVTTSTPPAPGAITAPFSGSPCAGQSGLTYSIAPVTGASAYTWTVPAGWTIDSGQGTTSITVTTGSAAGTVSVRAENGCGSSTASTLFSTPTSSTPITSGIISGPVAPCVGNTATTYATDVVIGATGYTWTVPAGWSIDVGQGTTSITVTPDGTAGQVSVVASNGCGAGTATTLTVTPTTTTPVIVGGAINGNANVCSNETGLAYFIKPVAGAENYFWTVPDGWLITSGQGTDSITVEAGSTDGYIKVIVANQCGNGTADSLAVIIRSSLTFTGKIQDESSPCKGLKYSVTPVPGATSYDWVLPAGWKITSGVGTPVITVEAAPGRDTISVTAKNASCTSVPVSAVVDAKALAADLEIPNVFSPNGNDINEQWEIKNLESYPDNELTVINRWGNEVYKQKGYRNSWQGGSLSGGTYYYILRVKLCNNEEKTFKGYVMIVR